MLCDDLEEWDREGGRETEEGDWRGRETEEGGDMEIYVYI